jgi:hypothetical protein
MYIFKTNMNILKYFLFIKKIKNKWSGVSILNYPKNLC